MENWEGKVLTTNFKDTKLGFLSFSFVFCSFWTLNVATDMYNSLKSPF